jgi:hypothetical protein
MKPDLSDEDIADLAKLIMRAIDDSRYPFPPEVRRWKELLTKLRPEPDPRALAAAEGVCAAIERPIPATRLGLGLALMEKSAFLRVR